MNIPFLTVTALMFISYYSNIRTVLDQKNTLSRMYCTRTDGMWDRKYIFSFYNHEKNYVTKYILDTKMPYSLPPALVRNQ